MCYENLGEGGQPQDMGPYFFWFVWHLDLKHIAIEAINVGVKHFDYNAQYYLLVPYLCARAISLFCLWNVRFTKVSWKLSIGTGTILKLFFSRLPNSERNVKSLKTPRWLVADVGDALKLSKVSKVAEMLRFQREFDLVCSRAITYQFSSKRFISTIFCSVCIYVYMHLNHWNLRGKRYRKCRPRSRRRFKHRAKNDLRWAWYEDQLIANYQWRTCR